MAHEAGGVPVVANPFAADVLADEALGFEFINGTVRITFGSLKMVDPVPPSEMQMVVIGRLVIGVAGAQRLALGLFDYLKSQGADPANLVSNPEEGRPN